MGFLYQGAQIIRIPNIANGKQGTYEKIGKCAFPGSKIVH